MFKAIVSPFLRKSNLASIQKCNIWQRRWDPFGEIRSMIRQMERTMDVFGRDIDVFTKNRFPFAALPVISRPVPLGELSSALNKYRLNLDMADFKPENIKINLKDRVLTIHGKHEIKNDDGSYFNQEVKRQYVIPEDVIIEELKSILTDDGLLCIEAPRKHENPQQIKIEKE